MYTAPLPLQCFLTLQGYNEAESTRTLCHLQAVCKHEGWVRGLDQTSHDNTTTTRGAGRQPGSRNARHGSGQQGSLRRHHRTPAMRMSHNNARLPSPPPARRRPDYGSRCRVSPQFSKRRLESHHGHDNLPSVTYLAPRSTRGPQNSASPLDPNVTAHVFVLQLSIAAVPKGDMRNMQKASGFAGPASSWTRQRRRR